ncbi:alpha/beta hydrolase [Lacibacter luteus]|uniref:Alpha/beta hydrolase n=1 Tax=Lacibacter luteus TaxID=2508719 RepID=A0A4Q1CPC8_9BACT|nr:dienelactone hydrolase family protein [Lacibacter luteus]RXK62635.1 alpha/beta hydrolase [Lacibacter luteus]
MNFRFNNEVAIPLGDIVLKGELSIPLSAEAIVIFSHTSGNGRNSARNKMVATYLHQHHIGTLLFDLLTTEEELQYQTRFDVAMLTQRLYGTTRWLQKQPTAKSCSLGFFAASTGAASALKASLRLPEIEAVVCRGGRPDLAMQDLPKVKAPVLLIVGSYDTDVLALNRNAYNMLTCRRRLDIVENATHLFEEDGKMEIVEKLACKWFEQHLLMADHHVHKSSL